MNREWIGLAFGAFLGVVQKALPARIREKWEAWEWREMVTLAAALVFSVVAYFLCKAGANIGVDCSQPFFPGGLMDCLVAVAMFYLGNGTGTEMGRLGWMTYDAIRALIKAIRAGIASFRAEYRAKRGKP